MGGSGGGFAKSSDNFLVAKKSLIYSIFCSIKGICEGGVG